MKVRDIPPFGLRMQPEMKAKLEREKLLSGRRSLNDEIVARLQESLEGNGAVKNGHYTLHDNGGKIELTEADRMMLHLFKKLPAEKQLALLSLFR